MSNSIDLANECAKVLALHDGNEVVVLDLRQAAYWTDCFVIASGNSTTHLNGLERHLEEFLHGKGIKPYKGNRARYPTMRHDPDDEEAFSADDWKLIDCGDFVVHLMSARARAFYELEKLWFQAPRTDVKPERPDSAGNR